MLRVTAVVSILGSATSAAAQGSGTQVWYTLTNRVAILAAPNLGAAKLGTIPTPSAVCGLRTSGRFVEVRFVTQAGQVLGGYVERLRLDATPIDPSQTRRLQDVCAVSGRNGASRPTESSVAQGRGDVAGTSSASRSQDGRPSARISLQVRALVEEQFRRLAFAQEWYYSSQFEYSGNLEGLAARFTPPPDMSITILGADTQFWSARIGVAGVVCDVSHSVSVGSAMECR